MQVQSLSREDPLEEEVAIHSSILAWRIPWVEEPGRLWYIGSLMSWTWLKWLSTAYTDTATIILCFIEFGRKWNKEYMSICSQRGSSPHYSCFCCNYCCYFCCYYTAPLREDLRTIQKVLTSQILQELSPSLFATQTDFILDSSFLPMFQLVDAPGKWSSDIWVVSVPCKGHLVLMLGKWLMALWYKKRDTVSYWMKP